jgi:hypothetical protein
MKQKRQSPVNIELVLFTVKMKQKRQSPENDHSISTGD